MRKRRTSLCFSCDTNRWFWKESHADPATNVPPEVAIVELPERLEAVEQAAHLVVGVGQEGGEGLHVAGEDPAGVGRQRRPLGNPLRPG